MRKEIIDKKCNEDINSAHFVHALKFSFSSSGLIPMVFGVHGEPDKKTTMLIKKCATFAVARSDNAHVTQLSDNNQKRLHLPHHAKTIQKSVRSDGNKESSGDQKMMSSF